MKKILIKFLATTFLSCTIANSVLAASTDKWPSKTINLVTPTTAGGTSDIIARSLAEKLSDKLGQSVIVLNKPGASGTIGIQSMLRSRSDGHTYVFGYPSNLIVSKYTIKDLSFEAKKELAPIAGLVVNEMVVNVSNSVSAKNPKEFIEWLQKESKEGKEILFGSYGHGSYGHIVPDYFNKLYGINAVHVPYKSEKELLLAIAQDEVAYGLSVVVSGATMQQSGKSRMIGLLSPNRSEVYPDIPTFKEFGVEDPTLSLLGWYGLFANKNTSPEILKKMETAVLEVLQSSDMTDKILSLYSTPWGATADELNQLWDKEIPIYKKLAESSGLLD